MVLVVLNPFDYIWLVLVVSCSHNHHSTPWIWAPMGIGCIQEINSMFFPSSSPMIKKKLNIIKYETRKCHHLCQSLWLATSKHQISNEFSQIWLLLENSRAWKHVHLFRLTIVIQSWFWALWFIHIFWFKIFIKFSYYFVCMFWLHSTWWGGSIAVNPLKNHLKFYTQNFQLTFWLWKIICHCSLWRVFSFTLVFSNYLPFFLESKIFKKHCLMWWKKLNKNIICQN